MNHLNKIYTDITATEAGFWLAFRNDLFHFRGTYEELQEFTRDSMWQACKYMEVHMGENPDCILETDGDDWRVLDAKGKSITPWLSMWFWQKKSLVGDFFNEVFEEKLK